MPPTRITFEIDPDLNMALIIARAEDGLPAAERVRAALHLWDRDPEVRERIDGAARSGVASPAGPQVKQSISLLPDLRRAMALSRAHDRITVAARVRAALHLWQADADMRARIDDFASTLRRERVAGLRGRTGAGQRP